MQTKKKVSKSSKRSKNGKNGKKTRYHLKTIKGGGLLDWFKKDSCPDIVPNDYKSIKRILESKRIDKTKKDEWNKQKLAACRFFLRIRNLSEYNNINVETAFQSYILTSSPQENFYNFQISMQSNKPPTSLHHSTKKPTRPPPNPNPAFRKTSVSQHHIAPSNVCMKNGPKQILHFWYKNWPDKTPPVNKKEFLSFIEKLYNDIIEHKGFTVIHCSAGIGRTGLVYIILSLKFKINDNKNKNYIITEDIIITEILNARLKRIGIIQTYDQYKFICTFYKIEEKNITLTKEDFDKLSVTNNLVKPTIIKCSINQNRYINITPYNPQSIVLKDDTCKFNSDPICPTYINASEMDPFTSTNEKFHVIAASCPTPASEQHFYKMLDQYDVKRIVMLTDLMDFDKVQNRNVSKCNSYVKEENNEDLALVDDELIIDTSGYPVKQLEKLVQQQLELSTDNNTANYILKFSTSETRVVLNTGLYHPPQYQKSISQTAFASENFRPPLVSRASNPRPLKSISLTHSSVTPGKYGPFLSSGPFKNGNYENEIL